MSQAVQINIFGPTDETCGEGQSEEETCCGEHGNPPRVAAPLQVKAARSLRDGGPTPIWFDLAKLAKLDSQS